MHFFCISDQEWCQQKRQRWWWIREAEGFRTDPSSYRGREGAGRWASKGIWHFCETLFQGRNGLFGKQWHLYCNVCAVQGCVNVQSEDSLLLRAPKDSRNMKSAERGVSQSLHKFTFTKVMHPLLRKSSNIAFHWQVSPWIQHHVHFFFLCADFWTTNQSAGGLWSHHEGDGTRCSAWRKPPPLYLWCDQLGQNLHHTG